MPIERKMEEEAWTAKYAAERKGKVIIVSYTRKLTYITKKYESWKRALEISWKEYLSEIAKNPLTGEWAKEVAEYLAKSGEKQDVADS